ncbi:MAG: hypothetical protein IRZ28_16620 [Steroidobacteraceae bacterium]|nr:hypothetical protein [Steroidobacteraceae bacterium]
MVDHMTAYTEAAKQFIPQFAERYYVAGVLKACGDPQLGDKIRPGMQELLNKAGQYAAAHRTPGIADDVHVAGILAIAVTYGGSQSGAFDMAFREWLTSEKRNALCAQTRKRAQEMLK